MSELYTQPLDDTWIASPGGPLCQVVGGRRRWAEDPDDPLKDLPPEEGVEIKFILSTPLRPAALTELRRRHPEAIFVQAETQRQRYDLRPFDVFLTSREECKDWLRKNFPGHLHPESVLCVLPPRLRRLDPECTQILEGGLLDACKESATLQVHTALKSWHRAMNQLFNLGSINPVSQLPDLRRRDCVIVGAGPSLAFTAGELKNRGDAFVICCDGALAALVRAGVRPDAVATLDDSLLTWRFAVVAGPAAHGIPLIASSSANHVLLRHWQGPVILAGTWPEWEPGPPEAARVPSGLCVGHFALALALACGAPRVILTGFDLAYRDGVFHAPGMAVPYFHDRLPPDECQVLDWDGVGLRTDRSMLMYLRHFEEMFRANPQSEFIDATEGGARKQGCQRLTLAKSLAEAALHPPIAWTPLNCRLLPPALPSKVLNEWAHQPPAALLQAFAVNPDDEDLALVKSLCRQVAAPAAGDGWLLLATPEQTPELRQIAAKLQMEIAIELDTSLSLPKLVAALSVRPCAGILATFDSCPPDLAAIFQIPLREWAAEAPPSEAQRHRWIPGYGIICRPLHEMAWRNHIGLDLTVMAWEHPS